MTTATATALRVGDVLPALKTMKRLFNKKNSLENTLRIDTTDDVARLLHSGNSATTVVTIPAPNAATGGFAVDASQFANRVAKLIGSVNKSNRDLPFPIKVEADTITMTFDDINVTMPQKGWEEVEIAPVDYVWGTITGDMLKTAWQAVRHALGTDYTLPMLTGVNMELVDNTATFSATDSFRMATFGADFNTEAATGTPEGAVLLPGKVLEQVVSFISPEDQCEVTVVQRGRTVGFIVGGVEVIATPLDAQFPNLSPLIPKEMAMFVSVNRADFAGKVAKMKAQVRNSQMRLIVEGGVMEIRMEDHNGAEVVTSLPVTVYGDENIVAAFNRDYMVEALGASDSERVVLGFTEPSRPALFLDDADDISDNEMGLPQRRHCNLLMPVRLPG